MNCSNFLLTKHAEYILPSLVAFQHPPLLIAHLPVPDAEK